ncbi:MAG: hypothetical protein ABEK04_00440 [Candidatus Nanohalobium sp.]
MADFNPSTNTLEYCNNPYRQTKTKNIYYCESNGNGQADSWETKGDWNNPTPSCGSGDTYKKLKTMQRNYRTCGKVDAEDNPNVNKTTTVDENQWFCPSAKALSMRHKPGNLEAGIGISGKGYTSLQTMSYRSNTNMSYNVMAAVPACVNRVPMINLNVEMKDPYSGETTEKTGIYAAHMNLYYGPTGSKGQLKKVQLPDQKAFRRQYNVDINSKSYRMWAWRQRFAGAVQEAVNRKNLKLPKNVDVSEIAEDYRDSGKSVGELWLSSDFLYGAESGDPSQRTVEITRRINSTCTQDITQISERDFDSASEFTNFVKSNESKAIDILGKSGGNYCSMDTNETLVDIRGSEPTGGSKIVREELTGWLSTKILDNETGQLEATVDVRKLNTTFINQSGKEEKVNTTDEFMYYYENDEDSASQALIEDKANWSSDTNLSMLEITEIKNVNQTEQGEGRLQYNVSIEASFTRYMTGEDFEEHSDDYIEEQLEKHVYGANNSVSDVLKPVSRFEDKQIAIDGVISHQSNGTYSGQMRLETVENIAEDNVYIYLTYEKQEIAKKSWSWRALQGITMTTLAKCMYNWDQCMINERDLPSRSWEGHEVVDAGYGPWKKTNTFSWSSRAAEDKGEKLQDLIDDTNFYNQSVDVTFDKYYDGARGRSSKSGTPVNVYRTCKSGQGWTSAKGEFYVADHFICPTSGQTNTGSSANPSQVYRCAARPAQLPVKQASEYDARKLNGDWYVCRTMSPGKWYKDQGKPDVYVQKEQGEQSSFAEVACVDEVATCNKSSYRLKIYDPGEQPLECPDDYSAYDTKADRVEIGSHKYVCAAAKDKVGKTGFSALPVEFGSENIQNLDAELAYPSSTLKLPYGETTRLFYTVTNDANEYRQVKVSLGGVNATFVDGTETKSFTMVENETREFEIKVTPAVPGKGVFWVETTDQTVGYKLNSTIQVSAPSSIGGVSQQQDDSNSVPGIGMIHIMLLVIASTYFFIFRN